MADIKYQTLYQRAYRQRKRQVTITLDLASYEIWKTLAAEHERSIPAQIFAAAESYRTATKLPSKQEENHLLELIRVMRGIANNLNQLAYHSNRFRRLIQERQTRSCLQTLEKTAHAFVHNQPLNKSQNDGGH